MGTPNTSVSRSKTARKGKLNSSRARAATAMRRAPCNRSLLTTPPSGHRTGGEAHRGDVLRVAHEAQHGPQELRLLARQPVERDSVVGGLPPADLLDLVAQSQVGEETVSPDQARRARGAQGAGGR